MDWYRFLTEDLLQSAYRAKSEFAWKKEDALKVIEILRRSGFVVIGVDIWIPTSPGPTIPTPFVYDWDAAHVGVPENSYTSVINFVESFEWDPLDKSHNNLPPYFNIVSTPQTH